MLSSLPPLFPHSPHTLWYPSLTTAAPPPPPSTPNPPSNQQHPTHQPPPHNQNRPLHPQRTLLTILHADETALQARKANIRRFGAGWLRPPGVGKTLQGMADERAEREEAEAQRGREEARIGEGEGIEEMEGAVAMHGDEEVGERDLDGDVPDADADGEGEEGGWMSEDEGGTMLEDEGVGDEGGDMDDEVPEAEEGSYEHTDTEVEDGSSEDGGVGRGPRLATFNTRTGEVVRTPGSGVGVRGGDVLGSSVYGNGSVVAPRSGGRRGAFGGMPPGLGEN